MILEPPCSYAKYYASCSRLVLVLKMHVGFICFIYLVFTVRVFLKLFFNYLVSLYLLFSFHIVSLHCFILLGNNQFWIILLFKCLGWDTKTRYLLHPTTKSVPVLFKYTSARLLLWERLWSSPSLTKTIIPSSFSKWMHIIWLLSHWPALHTPFHKIHFVAHFSYNFTVYSRRWVNLLLFMAKSSTHIFTGLLMT